MTFADLLNRHFPVPMDVALSAIEKHRRPGQTLNAREIAEICGCSRNTIVRIEKRALEKLRRGQLREHSWQQENAA